MADNMISNGCYSEKSKYNELLYFSSIICNTLTEMELDLKSHFPGDLRVSLMLSIKDKWIAAFYSMYKTDQDLE